MFNHELLTVAATAYENGRTTGQITVLLVIGAVLYRFLLRPFLMRRVAPPVRAAVAGVGIVAIVLFGLAGGSAGGEIDADRARADMLAGCVDSAGEQARSYCGCVVDEVMKRNGTSPEDLERFDAQMRATEEDGAPLPAVFQQSIDACGAGPASRRSA